MDLQSRKISILRPASEIFEVLRQPNNYETLLPESTEKFEIEEDSFIFKLKGMPEIKLKLKESIPNSKVSFTANHPAPFTLDVNIHEVDEKNTEVQLNFTGNFNPMISMMVKKPLTKFIETLVDNIEKL